MILVFMLVILSHKNCLRKTKIGGPLKTFPGISFLSHKSWEDDGVDIILDSKWLLHYDFARDSASYGSIPTADIKWRLWAKIWEFCSESFLKVQSRSFPDEIFSSISHSRWEAVATVLLLSSLNVKKGELLIRSILDRDYPAVVR